MSINHYHPPSIQEKGGVKGWMKFKGEDYVLMKSMIDARASVASIARALKLSYPTAEKRVRMYQAEQIERDGEVKIS